MLDLLKSLLPAGVAAAGGPIQAHGVSAFGVEELTLERAVPKRQHEFRSGRAYARMALHLLGHAPGVIPVGDHRQPVWPVGVVGSITHSDRLSLAIVARSDDFPALGIDLEEDTALDPDLIDLVCRPEERHRHARVNPGQPDRGKLLFVIKEAVYKAYFPVAGAFLEFRDVAVTIDMRRQCFHAKLAEPSKPAAAGRRAFEGRFGQCDGHLVAVVAVRMQ